MEIKLKYWGWRHYWQRRTRMEHSGAIEYGVSGVLETGSAGIAVASVKCPLEH